jgi:hypothetical protein
MLLAAFSGQNARRENLIILGKNYLSQPSQNLMELYHNEELFK